MGRFLMFVSYIGTHYSGLQIQNVGGCLRTDIKTVQGVLHSCLEKLKPSNEVKIYTSSRTDAGVHAFCNAVHFDLQHRFYPEKDYKAEVVTQCVNQILRKSRESIRVLKVVRVSDDFHCRHKARARRYVYRLCFIKDRCRDKLTSTLFSEDFASQVLFHHLPISPLEFNYSYCVVHDTDMCKVQEAADAFTGLHNFSAFTNPKVLKENDPVKHLTVGLKKGTGILKTSQHQMADCFDFWEVHFHSQSFLYRQVRRMVGTILKVGMGDLHVDELKELLEGPSKEKDIYANKNAQFSVPSYGLFLKSVDYNEEDLIFDSSVSSNTKTASKDFTERTLSNEEDKVISVS